MDGTDKVLDYRNMRSIPTYALYGEQDRLDGNWLHWETVTSRSRLYGFSISAHRHDELYQLLYLAREKATVMLDGQSYEVTPPALIVVPPLTVHGFVFKEDVEGFVLTLFERDVRALLEDAPEMSETLMEPAILAPAEGVATPSEFDLAVRQLVREADLRAPAQLAALRARVMLVLVLAYRLRLAVRERPGGASNRAGHHARLFQAMVNERYRETRRIGDYASALGITPTHLNRVCRQVFGMSALAVIERRIVLEAQRYLQFSPLSIKEISMLLGYPDPAYFSRFFTQRTGMAPQVFKVRHSG